MHRVCDIVCVLSRSDRDALVRAHLAPKTWENYNYGKRKLLRWLKESRRPKLDVDTFLDFVLDCANACLSYDVPNFARCWLAVQEKMRAGKQTVSASPRVRMALEGYKRTVNANRKVRSPIRLNKLLVLLHSPETEVIKLACLLAYVFLLRVSETVSLLQGRGWVRRSKKGYILFLPKSKADQEAKGVSVFFPDKLLPQELVPMMSGLLPAIRRAPSVDSSEVNAAIHRVLGATLTFHCLRHGRASDLFDKGTSLSKIMEIGRWATKAAVTCYLH